MLNPHSLFAFGSLVMRSGISWIILPNPSLAFMCPIYCATNLNLTNPTPHQLPHWIYYMSAQSMKIRHAALHLSLWNVNIFRALLTLLTPTVTNVPFHCEQALKPWPLLFTYNTELLNKMKNIKRLKDAWEIPITAWQSHIFILFYFFNCLSCLASEILEGDLICFPRILQINITNVDLTFSLHVHKAHRKVTAYLQQKIIILLLC